MVRVIIKGGVWKNTEDEILKAAIMKYGKNQWSRIASLLHRKSAKQCKARWFEWLDPRIKKTEWSREEDEKLLNLAKIMPTQWRTIAPIVGRTANQCLERYEQLLDEAQKRAEGLEEEDSLKEAKKLKSGDVDPTPETKPARPDPIDMDEDELEMLSEARARLANTQGKKAKRKAREKQLAEARRLASLQKKRELRAAGIVLTGTSLAKLRKTNQVDYNAEIPFEKPVPVGFHDPTEDKFHKKEVTKIEEKRRDTTEFEERKKDKEKAKRKRDEDNPESIFESKREKKRSRLVLPEPQVSDAELEGIVKMGQMTDSVRSMVDENPTSTLLHEFTEVNVATAARTARTPADAIDSVARAADDLLVLSTAETPLKGGINTPLHSMGFSTNIDQTKRIAATPNTVIPSVLGTPRTTMGANEGYLETPHSQRRGGATVEESHRMISKLGQLPKPRNEFELILPEDEEMSTDAPSEDWTDDQTDVEERLAKRQSEREAKLRLLRSQVFQRSLPTPTALNDQYHKKSNGESELARVDDLIKTEMYRLMEWDVLGKEPADIFTPEQMATAKALVAEEMSVPPPLDAKLWKVIRECSAELVRHQGRYMRLKNLGRREQIEALSEKFRVHYEWMSDLSKKTAKAEKKVKVLLGGYMSVQNNISSKMVELAKQREKLLTELKTFRLLEENEERAMVNRVETLMDELRVVRECQEALQKEFAALQQEHYVTSMELSNRN